MTLDEIRTALGLYENRAGYESTYGSSNLAARALRSAVDELERLQAALEQIASHFGSAEQCREIAKSALPTKNWVAEVFTPLPDDEAKLLRDYGPGDPDEPTKGTGEKARYECPECGWFVYRARDNSCASCPECSDGILLEKNTTQIEEQGEDGFPPARITPPTKGTAEKLRDFAVTDDGYFDFREGFAAFKAGWEAGYGGTEGGSMAGQLEADYKQWRETEKDSAPIKKGGPVDYPNKFRR